MKTTFLTALLTLIFNLTFSQNKDEISAIKSTVQKFTSAGDANDTKALEMYLDDNYRIVMNGLFGNSGIVIVNREGYLEKIGSKEWGGDSRKLEFGEVIVNNSSATIKVTFKGSKTTFQSLITLVKNTDGKWKLISDVPVFI